VIPPSPAVEEEPAAGAGNIEATPVSNTHREERTKLKHDKLRTLAGKKNVLFMNSSSGTCLIFGRCRCAVGARFTRCLWAGRSFHSLCVCLQVLLLVLEGLLPRASPSRRGVVSFETMLDSTGDGTCC
jgi:hypothetical protein